MNRSASAMSEVIAAVDLGSNSFHMVVARYSHGQLVIIDRLREMVRLASRIGEDGRLDKEAAARALQVGTKYPPGGSTDAEVVALGDPAPDAREMRLLDGLVELTAIGRWQRPAAVVLDCDISAPLQCRVGNVSLGGAEVVLNVPGSAGALRLRQSRRAGLSRMFRREETQPWPRRPAASSRLILTSDATTSTFGLAVTATV